MLVVVSRTQAKNTLSLFKFKGRLLAIFYSVLKIPVIPYEYAGSHIRRQNFDQTCFDFVLCVLQSFIQVLVEYN